MKNYYIIRNMIKYNSDTKEQSTYLIYFKCVDNDIDKVIWTTNKTEAKAFSEFQKAEIIATELQAKIIFE